MARNGSKVGPKWVSGLTFVRRNPLWTHFSAIAGRWRKTHVWPTFEPNSFRNAHLLAILGEFVRNFGWVFVISFQVLFKRISITSLVKQNREQIGVSYSSFRDECPHCCPKVCSTQVVADMWARHYQKARLDGLLRESSVVTRKKEGIWTQEQPPETGLSGGESKQGSPGRCTMAFLSFATSNWHKRVFLPGHRLRVASTRGVSEILCDFLWCPPCFLT